MDTAPDRTPAHPDTAASLRVLFVCSANVARSPYAERRAVALLHAAGASGEVQVASAGVPGWPDRGMDEQMAELVTARGGEATGHVSRAVSGDLLADADLVLTFEFAQHMRLLDRWPQYRDRIIGFGQAVTAVSALPRRWTDATALSSLVEHADPDSMSLDVDDPYRRGSRAAASVADRIDAGLAVLVPFFVDAARGRAGSPGVRGQEPSPDTRRSPTRRSALGGWLTGRPGGGRPDAGRSDAGGSDAARRERGGPAVLGLGIGVVLLVGGLVAAVASFGTTTALWALAVVALGGLVTAASVLWRQLEDRIQD